MKTEYRDVLDMPFCGACGKVVTGGGLAAEREGRTVTFCSPACRDVFDDYVLPKYGIGFLDPVEQVPESVATGATEES
jgi:YHS domain.